MTANHEATPTTMGAARTACSAATSPPKMAANARLVGRARDRDPEGRFGCLRLATEGGHTAEQP